VRALGRVAGPRDRGTVGSVRLGPAAQPPQQVGADRVEQVVPVQVQLVYEGQRGGWAVQFGHCHRPVERHHRARRDDQQLVVEAQDLVPVGRGRDGRVTVDGADRGLDLVGAGLTAAQALPDQGLALGDQRAVPARPVLVGEQHQPAVRGRAGRPARLGEQHQREQPGHLGLVRHEPG
jgi:hypothetical protein